MTATFQIIERMPFEQYAALDDEHASTLRYMLVSPRAYLSRRQRKDTDTPTLRQGRAAHTAILEPQQFLRDYVLWTGGDKVKHPKEWKAFKEQTAASGKTILDDDEYNTANRMRDAVHDHPVAGPLFRERGRAELTIRWQHQRTGIWIKCRIDWLCSDLVDLKTTRDPSPALFSSTAARLNYPLQLALYADAIAAAGMGTKPVYIVAPQNCEPWDVVVYELDEGILTTGRVQYEDALDRIIACKAANEWPGQAVEAPVPLRLPAWATASDEPTAIETNLDIPY